MVIRDSQVQRLQLRRRLDKRHCEPGFNVPFDVAVEERNSGIVDLESEDGVAVAVDEKRVAPHGDGRGWSGRWGKWWAIIGPGTRSRDYLEVVGMQMEGMSPAIVIDECYFNDGAVGEDVRVRVNTVYSGVVD